MFEIGSSLRDARERRGIGLAECERATKIRASLLRAIEDERFDRLPEPAYTRGFLRTYARFLGVDEHRVLSEYDARLGIDDRSEHDLKPLPPPPPGPAGMLRERLLAPRRPRRATQGLGWLAIGGIGAVLVLLWLGGGGDETATPPPVAPAARPPAAAPPATTAPARPPAPPPGVRLRVTGAGDQGSYLEVRRGGPDGEALYVGTVAPGATESWRSPGPLWIRVGWTPSLRATVNGRAVALEGGTANFLVTRGGVRPADG